MHVNKKVVVEFIADGQKDGEIRNDLDQISIFRTVIGSMRLLITQWCYNNYSFDLKKEGENLWSNIKKMIKGEYNEKTNNKN